MAKKKSSNQGPIAPEDQQQEFFDVAEVDDASFDDDWDDDADMGDEWAPPAPKKKKKESKKAEEPQPQPVFAVEDHSADVEASGAGFGDEDFGDEDFGEGGADVDVTQQPDADGEVYDVPEGPAEEEEVYEVPEGPLEQEEVYAVPKGDMGEVPADDGRQQTYEGPEAAQQEDDFGDETEDVDVAMPAPADAPVAVAEEEAAEDVEDVDIGPLDAQADDIVDVDVPVAQDDDAADTATQPQVEAEPVVFDLPDDAIYDATEEEAAEAADNATDAVPAEATAEEQTAPAATGEPVEGETAEGAEDVPAEDIPEEEAKSDEEREREERELEEYRSMMGDTDAEMADVSEYRNYRRKTKTESKSSKPKKSDFDLFANRYKVKTMNATVAATDPIVYFYNACLRANGTIMLFNVYQVLQDRFLGKMVPQLFTAVAESSNKIDELNEANLLAQLSICAEFPQYEFIISISAHAFVKPAILERLLKSLPEGGVPNLVFAFDCASLQSIANAAKAGLSTIRAHGVKVLLDNTERVTMDVLSEMEYDYMRIDARYYEIDNPRAEAYLRLILSFAKEQGIGTIGTFCDTEDMADYMLFMGVDAVQGNAVSRPMRTVPNSVRAITLLPSMMDSDE